MECKLIGEGLTNFYFGAQSKEERETWEHHLLKCERCLTDFFEIKDHAEIEASPHELPVLEVRDRLKARVSSELTQVSPWFQKRKFWAGIAAAASLVALLTGVLRYGHELSHSPSVSPSQVLEIDSARDRALSVELL